MFVVLQEQTTRLNQVTNKALDDLSQNRGGGNDSLVSSNL